MKNKSAFISLLLFGAVLGSCQNAPIYYDVYEKSFNVELYATLNDNRTSYSLPIKYADKYFIKDANIYDKKLSELSFGCAAAASTKEVCVKFFEDSSFTDITTYQFDEKPSVNTCAHLFAHKKIEDYDLFAVTFRWHNYQKERSNNFTIGKEGDHQGFSEVTNVVYRELIEYIDANSSTNKIKLWINGYSRGGGIANYLSSLILRSGEIKIEQSDMYVYTYEAVNGLTREHALPYKNVHNVINSGDICPHLAPNEYGLYRCGVDHDIYDINVSTITKSFDSEINIPNFIQAFGENDEGSIKIIKNDPEFIKYVFRVGFVKNDLLDTREKYVDNYQDALSYCMGMVFSLSRSTEKQVILDLEALSLSGIASLVSSSQALFDFLKPYFDKDGIEYSEEEAINNIEIVRKMAAGAFYPLLGVVLMGSRVDLFRMVMVHCPEVVYPLLLNYHKKK